MLKKILYQLLYLLIYTYMIFKLYLELIFSYLCYKSTIPIRTRTSWYISYKVDEKSYKIVFPLKLGKGLFDPPIKVLDENEQDVTKDVFECMGVNHDFHGISTSPRLLGYKKLSFCYLKENKVFYNSDIINI